MKIDANAPLSRTPVETKPVSVSTEIVLNMMTVDDTGADLTIYGDFVRRKKGDDGNDYGSEAMPRVAIKLDELKDDGIRDVLVKLAGLLKNQLPE